MVYYIIHSIVYTTQRTFVSPHAMACLAYIRNHLLVVLYLQMLQEHHLVA